MFAASLLMSVPALAQEPPSVAVRVHAGAISPEVWDLRVSRARHWVVYHHAYLRARFRSLFQFGAVTAKPVIRGATRGVWLRFPL